MRALIIVDVQNDFCPGGALAVPDGDAVIPVINQLMKRFSCVVATQDWHPQDHGSFAANHPGADLYSVQDLNGLPQVMWPVHCVQGSPGAELHMRLNISLLDNIIYKGTDPAIDSYSGFYDNGRRKGTGMDEYLQERGITEVFVCGLATDYCVKATAVDAASLGYKTWFVKDASRGVNLNPDDVNRAVLEMEQAGIGVILSTQVPDMVVIR